MTTCGHSIHLLAQAKWSALRFRTCSGCGPPLARLSAVGCANADPGIAHLLIVDLRIVNRDVQAQVLHAQRNSPVPDARKLKPEISAATIAIIACCMQKKREERYQIFWRNLASIR